MKVDTTEIRKMCDIIDADDEQKSFVLISLANNGVFISIKNKTKTDKGDALLQLIDLLAKDDETFLLVESFLEAIGVRREIYRITEKLNG